MPTTNFYFATLDFPQTGLGDFTGETYESNENRLLDRVFEYVDQSEVIYVEELGEGEEALWRFGRCEVRNGRLFGKLGKAFTEEQTQWDPEEEDYRQGGEEIEVADVSHFIFFPDVPGIVFNRKHRIGPNQFEEAFVNGYNEDPDMSGFMEMTIIRVGGDKEFEEVVESAQEIHEIEFDLEPTNPYPHDEMEILDDHIRDMNADEFSMAARIEEEEDGSDENGDPDSLDPEEDFIRSGAAMSEGGYGSYVMNYLSEDGEEREYNSRGVEATEELDEPETIGGLYQHARHLYDLLSRLASSDSHPQDED